MIALSHIEIFKSTKFLVDCCCHTIFMTNIDLELKFLAPIAATSFFLPWLEKSVGEKKI